MVAPQWSQVIPRRQRSRREASYPPTTETPDWPILALTVSFGSAIQPNRITIAIVFRGFVACFVVMVPDVFPAVFFLDISIVINSLRNWFDALSILQVSRWVNPAQS